MAAEIKVKTYSITLIFLIMFTASSNCHAQNAAYQNYSNNFGSSPSLRKYNYTAGFGGKATNNAFNNGFSGLSQNASQINYSQHTPSFNKQEIQRTNSEFGDATTMEDLEKTLNAIDNKKAWSRTPVSMSSAAQNPMPSPRPGIMPAMSRQEMLRIFMESGTVQNSSPSFSQAARANSSASANNAYSNYQTANNEANKARNDADKARYDKDKWSKKNYANYAEYAANNANYAASRAESAANSGDSQAMAYAKLARQAANRARASANQARYNADTMR